MPTELILTRDVSREECGYLLRDMKAGERVTEWTYYPENSSTPSEGYTGVVGSADTYLPGDGWFALPSDALAPAPIEAPPEPEACGNCRYMRTAKSQVSDVTWLECKRRAPRMDGWPVVQPTDWCGEYQREEAAK